MVFRRILPLIALLFGVAACTLPSNPPQTAASAAAVGQGTTQAGVPALPREIEREVGAALCRRGAAGLCRWRRPEAGRPVGPWPAAIVSSCSICRSPMPMPWPNYVFVTRGLLASLDDEAELAAALGHELGHLVAAPCRPARPCPAGRARRRRRGRGRRPARSRSADRWRATACWRSGAIPASRNSKPTGSACRCSCAPAIAATPWPA